ncbi:Fanconi anemia group M protein [Mizuhopecten yessoensis]|uniref:Fanconi anemia group M protein n=1 Tax=Mizuhopecten yessoensis TaxID=6573 RepID=A0A210QQ07_MIZYE|nr:Fanconi anemia group M protein [Mizuhopecten yessoensis]
MNKGKQATLFQSWGAKKSKPVNSLADDRLRGNDGIQPGPSLTADHLDIIDLCDGLEDDDDEDLLAQAMDNVDMPGYSEPAVGPSAVVPPEADVCNISLGAESFPGNVSFTQTVAPEGFDKFAGKTWIYPTNYSVRDYQFNICQQVIYKNTMVTLPTGLGKTFIAAVAMYNFYRWYPQGKVVFMAPTKPLVAQQIEACYNIMGIPQADTAEMTGNMAPTERKRTWMEKRVFFLTPQVLTNDLSRGTCPAVRVRCLVVDEAHKALGNHAYCQVVRELVKYTENFRILALSATPGSDIKAVQQVLSNLLISHIEIRTEDSIDIKQFSHERKVEKIVVPLGDELTLVKKTYIQVMDVVVNRLKRQGVLYKRETTSFSKFLILKARDAFRQNPPQQMQRSQYGAVEGDLALAMSLYHGFELLQLHGQRSLYNYLESIVSGEKGHGRTRTELMKNANFVEMMEKLRSTFVSDPNIRLSQKYKDGFKTGHPKMEKLEEVVVNHFNNFLKGGSVEEKSQATRVMIFSQYRDSVSEITEILKQHQPLVKVMSFIGQSSAGKATKGFTQKEQLKVMKDFREGSYNTLVSTCVGEEGLDIGEVDLIVCFDAHKSPIRLVQRMGRTGRKRQGRIVMLVTEGKEEQIYNQSQYAKKSIHKAILNGAKSLHFYQNNPRMVPEGWMPACHKMHITVKQNIQSKNAPKNASKVNRDSRQSKIKFQSKSTADGKGDDGLLTAEEYRDLIQNFSVPADSLPTLPSRLPLLALGEEHEVTRAGERRVLCEWLPWQNRLQQTFKIDHSTKTKNFVELMQFSEIQQTLDPNEDPYGDEMSLFLNEDDVMKPEETSGRGGAGIRKFCISVDKGGNLASTVQKGKGRRVRKSEVLPVLEISGDEDSEDDLPDFNINRTRNEQQTSFLGNKKGKKGKRQLLPKSVSVLTEIPESASVVKKNKKDKKRSVSGDRSVVQLIADTESRDFTDEEDNVSKVLPPLDETMSHIDQEIETVQDNQDVIQEDMDLSDINYSPLEVSNHEQMEVENGKEEDWSVSQLLPKVSLVHLDTGLDTSETLGNANLFHVRTPPPLEQVRQIVADLDKCEKLPPLDLLQLVDEWEKENQDYHYQKGRHCQLHGSAFKGTKGQSGRDQALGRSSSEERSPTSDDKVMNVSSGTGRKSKIKRRMLEPLQDIHIHTAHRPPPKISVESLQEHEHFDIVGHNEIVSDESDLECNHSDAEAFQNKGREPLQAVPSDKETSPVNQAHVPPRKAGVEEEVLSDDSDIFIDTQANFALTVNVDEDPFEVERKSSSVTSDEIQNDLQNVVLDSKVNEEEISVTREKSTSVTRERSTSVTRERSTSVTRERSTSLSSDDNFFDTQANFSLQDDDLFGDADIHQSHTDTKKSLSSAGNIENQECSEKVEEIKLMDRLEDLEKEKCTDSSMNVDSAKDRKLAEEDCSKSSVKPGIGNWSSVSAGNNRTMPCRSADVSLFDDSYDNEMLKALKTQRSCTVSPTQFTFTQALACVHDSNELPSENSENDVDPEQGKKSGNKSVENDFLTEKSVKEVHKPLQDPKTVCNKTPDRGLNTLRDVKGAGRKDIEEGSEHDSTSNITNHHPTRDTGDSSDECSKDSFDLPHFDLGFDVDEDVIPPSPCASQSFSQKSFSACLSQSLLKSRKSLSTKFDSSCVSEKPSNVNSNKVGGTVGMSLIEEDSEEFSDLNPVISKPGKSFHLGKDSSEFSRTVLVNGKKSTKHTTTKIDCDTNSANSEGNNNETNLGALNKDPGNPINLQRSKSSVESVGIPARKSLNSLANSKVNHRNKFEKEHLSSTGVCSTNLAEENHSVCDISDRTTINNLKRSPLNIGTPKHKMDFRTPDCHLEPLEINSCNVDKCEVDDGSSPVSDRSPIHVKLLSPGSEDEIIVRKKRSTMILDSPSPVFTQTRKLVLERSPIHAQLPSPESEDDIVVRKKRRTMIIESPSPVFTQNRRRPEDQTTPFRTLGEISYVNTSTTGNHMSSLTKDTKNKAKKLRFNVSFKLPELEEFDDDDDDDFADDKSALARNRSSAASEVSRKRSTAAEKKIVKRRTKSKSPADMFINAEAEMSDDHEGVSDDEDDGSDMDQMDDSFIGEATQMSQGRHEDMQAFYLKSVRSPNVGRKFRLKHNQGNIDVFSQPQNHEQSYYMQDSFCVDDDFEETGVDFEEEEEEEEEDVTLLDDPDVTYVGRRTRWSKPAAVMKKKVVKNVPGRKRIQKMSDSSSDEESKRCEVTTVATPRVSDGKRRGRVLLSSSTSDEEMDCKNGSPPRVISPAGGTQDVIPSLMTRIKNHSTVNSSCVSELRSKIVSCSTSTTGSSKSSHVAGVPSHQRDKSSAWLNTSHSAADKSVPGLNISHSEKTGSGLNTTSKAEQMRAERLLKQKEKQEEFKRRMAEKTMENAMSESSVTKSDINKSKTETNEVIQSECDTSSACAEELVLTTAPKENANKSVIFVDSREINGSQNIVSELRFKHNISVVVAQLAGCDYVVSNRMGVDRKVWSEFTNGSNHSKLIDRIQQLCELYDRPCLIIESDPVKGSDKGGNRLLHWTKYVDRTIVQLINSSIKTYFTAGQLDTAAILADLCMLETRKNMVISVPVNVSDKKQQHVKFYSSIPKLTHIHSLNLAYNFRTIKDFLSASVQAVKSSFKFNLQALTKSSRGSTA